MGILATSAPDLTDGFLALALAAVVSLLATPVAGALAWRIGAIDHPRERELDLADRDQRVGREDVGTGGEEDRGDDQERELGGGAA